MQGLRLVILLNFCAKNPRLRQAPKRYMQFPTMSFNKLLFFLSFALLTFYGCKNNRSHKAGRDEWNKLTIGFDSSQIVISNIDNSAILTTVLNYKKSTVNSTTTYTPDKIEETTIKIASNEKDSIYFWAKKLISDPFEPKTFCTDYAGKLFLDIEINEQVTQSCRYNSICEWSTMNTETLKLYKLLKNKFKLE